MIGIVMAGGKGSRMDLPEEKLLLQYKKPIILHVIDALQESNCFSKIIAVTSPNSPKTKQLLESKNIETFSTVGEGYAIDLNKVLSSINDDILVTSGDLPFLDSRIIQKIVSMYNPENIWTTFLVTKGYLESLGLTSDFLVNFQGQDCHYTGISLVNAEKITNLKSAQESYQIFDDKKIAFNLNTKQDYELIGLS